MKKATKKEREVAGRIKALYAKREPGFVDLRSEELSTMFDVFLGKTYDGRRKLEIARVQQELHNKQERLAKDFQAGHLKAEEYVDSLASLIGEAFARCKKILGPKDFERLFGASWKKEKDFIDRSVLVRTHGR